MAPAASLSRERFALLFAVMLVAASGNTAMQSLMPAIGRELGVADLWVAVAFSLSAVIWVLTAPYWARRADHRGRRALMRLGLYGFIASLADLRRDPRRRAARPDLGDCSSSSSSSSAGPSTAAGARPRRPRSRPISPPGPRASSAPPISPLSPPPSASARSSARRSRLCSSSSRSGLSGPLIVFAASESPCWSSVALRLPDDTPSSAARGEVVDYPSIGGLLVGNRERGEDDPAGIAGRCAGAIRGCFPGTSSGSPAATAMPLCSGSSASSSSTAPECRRRSRSSGSRSS